MALFGNFCIVITVLALGDILSVKTRGVLPSVFTISLLFLVGYWSGLFPPDIVQSVGLGTPLANFAMAMLAVQMGGMISFRRLMTEWRSVVITAAGVSGMVAFLLVFGRMLIGWETIVVATPPLTGGFVAAATMAEVATELGHPHLAILATVIYVFQGFVGYPLTAWCLRLEGQRLLEICRSAPQTMRSLPEEPVINKLSLSALLQATPFTRVALVAIVAFTATSFSTGIHTFLDRFLHSLAPYTPHPLVLCFLFGCLAAKYGIAESRPLARTSTSGFLVIVLTAHIMEIFAKATPEMVTSSLQALVVTIGVGCVGLICFAAAAGRFLGFSFPMAIALSLTALFGFPQNFLLADEAARNLSQSAEEYGFLMQQTFPQMMVGGFVTVLISSVIVAEIFVKILG